LGEGHKGDDDSRQDYAITEHYPFALFARAARAHEQESHQADQDHHDRQLNHQGQAAIVGRDDGQDRPIERADAFDAGRQVEIIDQHQTLGDRLPPGQPG